MSKKELSGSATLKQIANYYNVSVSTMQRKLRPYMKFFQYNKQKKIYYENELQLIKKLFGTIHEVRQEQNTETTKN